MTFRGSKGGGKTFEQAAKQFHRQTYQSVHAEHQASIKALLKTKKGSPEESAASKKMQELGVRLNKMSPDKGMRKG